MDIYSSNWDESDASNSDAAPDGAPEGMAASGVNDTMRAMMGATKRFVNQQSPKTTAGTSSSFTLTYDVAPGALVDGMSHLVQFNAANAANATLNTNSLGAIPLHILKPAGWGAIPANTVINGMVCRAVYNSSAGAYRLVEGVTSAVVASTEVYTVGPSGVRTQMGQIAVGVGSPAGVLFPIAFAAAPYTIQITSQSASGAPLNNHIVTTVSATGFTLINGGSSGNATFYWLAIGPT
jgi:hypothetical protein